MSKHLIIILLSLIFGLLSSAGSQTLWTKYPGNPVLEPGPPGEWDYSLLSPTILHKDNLYHMWYTGSNVQGVDRIGYATSQDGIIWTKYDDPATTNPPYSYSDPVIQAGSPGEWDQEISSPSVFWNETDSLFHMWYMAGTGAPHDSRIGYATSPNGITWTKYNDPTTTNPPYAESDPVLFPGSAGSWDASWVGGPWVLLIGNEYHMWYHAYSGSGSITRFGHATSPDGISWDKDINNPVLEPDPGTWDYPDLRRASVVFMESDSLYHMFYSGGVWSSTNWQVGHATAVHQDSSWTKDTQNPVLPRGPVGSWDAISASFCGVLVENSNQVKMWYSGTNDGIIAKFGLAISPVVLNVPGNFSTIQAAIDAANDGNIVLVEEGTYYENINFKGKAITVASYFIVDLDTNHINNTIINGSQPSHPDSGSVVYFVSGEDTTSILYGFTITNGTGTTSGYNKFGGGIFCYNSGCNIFSNKIIGNTAIGSSAYGGGFAVIGNTTSYAILRGNQIKYNNVESNTGWGQGGGVQLYLSAGEIIDNTISYNECKSHANQAMGGGIQCYGNIRVLIKNNLVTDNMVVSNAIITGYPESLGGGIEIWQCYAMVLKNVISNNTLNALENTSGAGIMFDNAADSSIIDGNIIVNNTANVTCSGGGINLWMSDAFITNNLVFENSATNGGGIRTGSCEPSVVNNTIINNDANYGGGIYFRDSNANVKNTILWGNQASTGPQIRIYGNSSVEVAYCDVEGGWTTGVGNIDADPLFADTIQFCLLDASPCIGAGITPCPPYDIYGNPRPMPADSMPDIGACESPLAHPVGIEPSQSAQLPKTYSLSQNYPNPFNPSTTFEFALPHSGRVTLKIYDILGQEVATLVSERLTAGKYKYEWDAGDLASGVYLYRLQAGDYVETRKMVLMR